MPLFVAVPILLLIASELGFFPWSGINCTVQEVDIYSGRIRHSRYLLFIPIGRRIEDSALTSPKTSALGPLTSENSICGVFLISTARFFFNLPTDAPQIALKTLPEPFSRRARSF